MSRGALHPDDVVREVCPMSGRLTQLGRQLRKLRNIVGGDPAAEPITTLRRATQLACELAREHTGLDEDEPALRALVQREVVDPALADRLVAWTLRDGAPAGETMQIGADLDRLLRSLESGASAPALPFEPIVPRDTGPAADSTAAVTVSGRLFELEVRSGHATVSIDKQLIAMATDAGEPMISFALSAAPTSRPETQHARTGEIRIVWPVEKLALEIAPDFARVHHRQVAAAAAC